MQFWLDPQTNHSLKWLTMSQEPGYFSESPGLNVVLLVEGRDLVIEN